MEYTLKYEFITIFVSFKWHKGSHVWSRKSFVTWIVFVVLYSLFGIACSVHYSLDLYCSVQVVLHTALELPVEIFIFCCGFLLLFFIIVCLFVFCIFFCLVFFSLIDILSSVSLSDFYFRHMASSNLYQSHWYIFCTICAIHLLVIFKKCKKNPQNTTPSKLFQNPIKICTNRQNWYP